MQKNRMFDEMLRAARGWLEGRDPADIARKAHAEFDGSAFQLECFGTALHISYPAYDITPEQDPWLQLLVLHCLHLADGFPLSGAWMRFGQYKDGLIRGGDFDRRVEQRVREKLSSCPPEELRSRCMALGGRCLASNADFCVEIPALPVFPLLLKIWFADEEFEASGRLLVDESAAHYLTAEDAVMLGEMILGKICT